MFYCNDLTRIDNFKDIRLVAGENGVYNAISRPFICYGKGFEEWISGDELVFINGKGIDTDEESLNDILKKCIDKKASGLVVFKNEGYIEEVPESMKELSSEGDFPLFESLQTFQSQCDPSLFPDHEFHNHTENPTASQ